MSKVGIIYCGYNTESYIIPSLSPWIEARDDKLGGHEFLIHAVCRPFIGFPVDSIDKTGDILIDLYKDGQIDEVTHTSIPVHETEARGDALRWLVAQGCDLTLQVDSDEFMTKNDIERILVFVEKSPLTWFRLSLKNFVFNEQTYLVEPFTPSRIHRTKPAGHIASGFWDDNNVEYTRLADGAKVHDLQFPNCTIPKGVAWVAHKTWLNDGRSHRKCLYQASRSGWDCSFVWDDYAGLMWNSDYFLKRGQPLPEVAHI